MPQPILSTLRGLLLGCAVLLLPGHPVRAQQTPTARLVSLDVPLLRRQLTPPVARGSQPTYRLQLPTLRGSRPFILTESFVLPAADTAARRRLRTFVGYEDGAPDHRASVVLTPQALTLDVLAGAESASLRPAGADRYELRPERATQGPCATLAPAGELLRPGNFSTLPAPFSFGTQLRRLRYAILVTQEFYTSNGSTDATVEQAVVTAMNQMSALYLQELALSYELTRPTSGSYYFSAMTTATLPGSDPATPGRLRDQNLGEVGGFINSRFASASFDLGHCFHNTGGGVAYVGVVCDATYKAQAWSGVGNRGGFQGILAHEMGHQHGAAHTFAGLCGSRSLGSNLEPGGGATIMAYTDVCGSQTLQSVPGTEADHFSTRSLAQMRVELLSVSCPTVTANTNRPPTVDAGPDYVIPRNTPFTLTASGTDPDGHPLAYTWTQFDYTATNHGALGSIAGEAGLAATDDPEAPLFRPRPPRAAPSRTFPDLRYVLANANRPPDLIGEALSNVGRELHFAVTARDQQAAGGTFATDNVTLTVAPTAGPFAVTTQNEPALWIGGQQATVTWAVNGTDQAPIGVQQVRISLSADGGQTFPTVLAASVPNTGSAVVTVPSLTTQQARVRIEAVGNVFFDINDANFPIAPCSPVASQTLPATDLTAPAGDAVLNLSQQGYSLTEYAEAGQLSGTISASDPTTNLTDYTGSSCTRYGNVTYYDAHVFVPSATATYRINTPTGFGNMVLRLYSSAGFDPANPCQNVVVDNYQASTLSRDVTASLTAGQPYTLVVSNFNGTPSGSTSYTISFSTTPAGGTAYAPLAALGYEYQYAVVNTANGQVVRLAPTADLRTLPAGTYDVHGLLFQRGYSTANLQRGSLSQLQAALGSVAPCGQLSRNARRVSITGGAAPLPVVLTRFSGRREATGNQLQWETASETDVSHFEVEYSPDGQQFTALSRVAATNSRTARTYSFTDARVSVGPAYYRLAVREQDGTVAYSGVVVLQAGVAEARPLRVAVAPNPVPGGQPLRLELESGTAQPAELRLTDLTGRVLLRQTITLPVGHTTLSLPETRAWRGLYLLTVQPVTGPARQQRVVLE